MAGPVAALSVLVTANAGPAVAQLRALDAAGRKAGDGIDDAARRHQAGSKAIQTAAKVGVVAVGALAAGAISLAADYETSMNKLQSVTGATEKQMKSLGKQAIALGADTKLPGTSAKDAAEAMLEMSKAGLSLENTQKGVRDVLVLSAAAQIDNAKAAEIASNALNSFKLQGKDVKMVTDQLANTANSSSVEITDVADSFKMAAAVFNGFQSPVRGAKAAMTELNTAIGILGNAGIKGSDAGTSLKQALLQLTGPSDKAKDAMVALYGAALKSGTSERLLGQAISGTGKERGAALEAMQKSNDALSAGGDIAYKANGQMRQFSDVIRLVAKGTRGMSDELRNAYLTQIFGADATRAVLTLIKAGPAEWDRMSAAVQKQGAAQDLANAKMKGFKGSMESFRSTIETLGITFGTTLLPPLTAFMGFMARSLGILGDHKTITLAVVAVIGSLSIAIVTVNAAMRAWTAATAAWAVITKAATAVQVAFNVVVAANPYVLAIVALVAFGVAIYVFRDKIKSVLDWLREHWPEIATIISGPFAPLTALATNGFGVRSALINAFESAASGVKRAMSDMVGYIASIPDRLLGLVKDAGDAASKFTRPIIDAFHDVKDIIVKVAAWVDKLIELLKDAVGWIGKIKIPDLNPLHALGIGNGGAGGGNVGPGVKLNKSGVDQFNDDAAKFGNVITSGYRPGDPGYHGMNRARDYSGGNMLAFAKYMAATYGSKLTELIHTPLGYGIKNGQRVGLGFWGNAVNADHFDHVHVALAKGGIVTKPIMALMGERGPEAVIPLSGRNQFGGGNTYVTFEPGAISGFIGDEERFADRLVGHINRGIARSGHVFRPQTN